MNTTHLPQYPLNGIQLECDGSELRPDGTCAKCERINERIESHYAAALPPTEATQPQTWCDHCSADLNDVQHILCERCYQDFARRINTRESLRMAILDWLAHRCNYAPVCGNCTYCRVAVFVRDMEATEATQPAIEAAAQEIVTMVVRHYETLSPELYHKVQTIISKHCTTDAGEVERLKAEVTALRTDRQSEMDRETRLVTDLENTINQLRTELSAARDDIAEWESHREGLIEAFQTAEKAAETARANAIREYRDLIEAKQAEWEVKGDYGTCVEYVHRVEGANEILESLAKGEGNDGPQ